MSKQLKTRDKINLKELLKSKSENYKKNLVLKGQKHRQEFKSYQSNLYYLFSSQAI